MMVGNLSDREFVVYPEVVSLRKGFQGLFEIIERENMTVEFFNNKAFVFINRRRNMFKCLYWENGSLAIWNKRLTRGTFASEKNDPSPFSFSHFLLFIYGFIPPENIE